MLALLLAQFLVSPDTRSMQVIRQIFERPAPKATLACEIDKLSPRLGFSLMHWSGFNLSIPLKQFPGEGIPPEFGIAIEITPKGGNPAYLGERFLFQKPPAGRPLPKDAAIGYTGGYYLGPGDYNVRVFASDNRNNECRKEWSLSVKAPKPAGRLEPNQIIAVGDERWRGLNKDGPPYRLTIVIEAAPLFPRRNMVRLSSYDRSVLLTSLTALLDQTKATAANVIAVDARNRKIIYTSNGFNRRELARLGRAVAEVNLGVVSLETLKGPNETAFMETVLEKLQTPAANSDAVVFLGPVWGWYGKVTPRIRELAQTLPNPHFLGVTRIAGLPDNLVAQVVRAGNGSVKRLLSPNDFAKAIEKVSALK